MNRINAHDMVLENAPVMGIFMQEMGQRHICITELRL